ncbi:MAG: hypothetical protein ABSC51_11925 [Gaiellaceae bacterium]
MSVGARSTRMPYSRYHVQARPRKRAQEACILSFKQLGVAEARVVVDRDVQVVLPADATAAARVKTDAVDTRASCCAPICRRRRMSPRTSCATGFATDCATGSC